MWCAHHKCWHRLTLVLPVKERTEPLASISGFLKIKWTLSRCLWVCLVRASSLRCGVTLGRWSASPLTERHPGHQLWLNTGLLNIWGWKEILQWRGSPEVPWQYCLYISALEHLYKSNPNCSTADNTPWDVLKLHPICCSGKVGWEPFKDVASVLCKETNGEVKVDESPGRDGTARSNYKSALYKSGFPRCYSLMGGRTKWFWHAKTRQILTVQRLAWKHDILWEETNWFYVLSGFIKSVTDQIANSVVWNTGFRD